MKQLKKVKNLYSLLAVCLVVLGLLLLDCPGMAVEVLYKISGIVLILLGIVKIMGYFSKDLFQLAFQFDLAMGIICGVFGIVLIMQTKRMMEIITVGLGLVMVTDALLRMQTTIDAKKFGMKKWWILLAISISVAIIGILLLFIPSHGTKIMIRLVGFNLCIDGILNFVFVQSTVKTIRRKKEWEQ